LYLQYYCVVQVWCGGVPVWGRREVCPPLLALIVPTVLLCGAGVVWRSSNVGEEGGVSPTPGSDCTVQ
jgi:hypothetical protein